MLREGAELKRELRKGIGIDELRKAEEKGARACE